MIPIEPDNDYTKYFSRWCVIKEPYHGELTGIIVGINGDCLYRFSVYIPALKCIWSVSAAQIVYISNDTLQVPFLNQEMKQSI